MADNFTVIVQARMTSSRLPGKVLLPVLGEPLLQHQLNRLKHAKAVQNIVVATTTNSADNPVQELCKSMNVAIFRGDELNVLGRYHGACEKFPSQNVIRVTADCPLIDPIIVDHCISEFMQSGYDYMSNSAAYPNGMNVEIFSSQMLDEAFKEATLPYEKEHVTPFFYTRPERYRIGQVRSLTSYEKLRLTVDTPEDYALISALLERLLPRKSNFTLDDIVEEFQKDPGLRELNSHIRQKNYNEV